MLPVLALLLLPSVDARETDQFSRRDRLVEMEDAAPALDAWVNDRLDRLASQLSRKSRAEHSRLIHRAFVATPLPILPTRSEYWVSTQPRGELERMRPGGRGIFAWATLADLRWTWFLGLAPTLKIAGVLLGLDKLGHFFSQGYQYLVERDRALDAGDAMEVAVQRARTLGHRLEMTSQGFGVDGIYSVADLAANWQGFRFLDSILGGDRPYLARTDGGYRRVRDFAYADFVTDDFDEALNPPLAKTTRLADRIGARIRAECQRARPPGPIGGSGRWIRESYLSGEDPGGFPVRPECL